MPGWTVREATKALDVDSPGDIVYTGAGASSWTNYSFTFNFKVDNTARIASAIFRFIGGAEPGLSYYFVNIQGGNTLTLAKAPSDSSGSMVLDTATISYLADTYYPVRIVVNGNNIKVYFNGSATADIDKTDDGATFGALQPAGSIGLGSPSTLHIFFDDIVVTAI